MSKPIVQLYDFDGLGLIIACGSGVLYSNQTGGYATLAPEIEGIFVPLTDPYKKRQSRLTVFFTGPKWRGHCYKGIDEETAGFVDSVLSDLCRSVVVKVDRSRLSDSHEAWIHIVVLGEEGERDMDLFSGFVGASGIFTWGNSD